LGLVFVRPPVKVERWLLPPLFTSLWFTAPRARVCRPRALVRERNRSRSRLGPDAPARVLVVCPARRTRLKATWTVCP